MKRKLEEGSEKWELEINFDKTEYIVYFLSATVSCLLFTCK